MSPTSLSGRALLLAAALSFAGCADDNPPGPTLDGVDPVQIDEGLTPDAGLQPEADIEPESNFEPEEGLPPEQTLQPDSSATL